VLLRSYLVSNVLQDVECRAHMLHPGTQCSENEWTIERDMSAHC